MKLNDILKKRNEISKRYAHNQLEHTILLESFYGSQCSCSPLFIYKYLISTNAFKPEDFTWVIKGYYTEEGIRKYCKDATDEDYEEFHKNGVLYKNPSASDFPPGVNLVCFKSEDYYRLYATAEIVITNNTIDPCIVFNKSHKQFFIHTTHGMSGSPHKLIGWQNKNERSISTFISLMNQRMHLDMYTLSCEYGREAFRKGFLFPDSKAKRIGLARTDPIIRGLNRNKLNKKSDELLVLYAPTGRDNSSPMMMNQAEIDPISYVLMNRFGKNNIRWIYLSHHSELSQKIKSNIPAESVHLNYDLTIPDLCIECDVIISDISSIMSDFAITGKPGFSYFPDYDTYLNKRGFMKGRGPETGPYPVAYELKDLIKLIRDFDPESNYNRLKSYWSKLESYEKDLASVYLFRYINDHWSRK